MIRLIEIKLDEQGNKSQAIVEDTERYIIQVNKLIDIISKGQAVKNAYINNNELYYVLNEHRTTNLQDKTFGSLTVLDYLGNKQWRCKCSCGKIKSIATSSLTTGKSTSCGHNKGLIDITDKTFGTWHVLEYAGEYYWKCECTCGCGTIRNVRGDELRNGKSTGCGRNKNQFIDMTDTWINDWHVLKYVGNNYWQCQCRCKAIRTVKGDSIRNGESKSCGHTKVDLKDTYINDWHVLEYIGDHKWKCQCSCGHIREVYETNLTQNISTSCGQCNRTDEQIEMTKSAEKFNSALLNKVLELNRAILISEAASLFGITTNYVMQLAKKYNSLQYLDIQTNRSTIEEEIALYIESLGVTIERNNRTILKNIELDIYIPKYNIGIEVNGDYWHSTHKKDKNYHLNKTLEYEKVGVRLIHIFEHEWKNKDTQTKIKDLLCKTLHISQKTVYARKCYVRQIANDTAAEFMRNYHLQNSIGCEEAYGLFYNNELLEVMTFGKCRFSSEYDTELLRLCSKSGYEIIGGASKLFKHYIKLYPTRSIISYCNHTKFIGTVYDKIGMTYAGHTSPDYIYINNNLSQVLSRYQCTKQKLIEQGYGTVDKTEEQIMSERGYLKIYNCGNKRYIYKPT